MPVIVIPQGVGHSRVCVYSTISRKTLGWHPSAGWPFRITVHGPASRLRSRHPRQRGRIERFAGPSSSWPKVAFRLIFILASD